MNIVMDGSRERRRFLVLLQISFQLALVWACPIAVNNPLGLGYVDSCVPPTANISSECRDIINWHVPEPVSSLASIKDAYISGILDQIQGLENGNCTSGIRLMLCSIEYPRCLVNTSQVDTAIQQAGCMAMLSSCSQERRNNFCSFTIQGVALDQCRTTEDYAIEYNYDFTFCNELGSDWLDNYITEWMFLYLKDINEEMKMLNDVFISKLDSSCRQKYISFKCNSVGRCWDQGTQVELVINQSICIEVRDNCLDSTLMDLFAPEFQCQVWTSASQLATEPTAITNETQPCSVSPFLSPSPSSSLIPTMTSSSQVSTPSVTPTSVTTSTPVTSPTTPSTEFTSKAPSLSASVMSLLATLLCAHLCIILIFKV